MAGPIKPSEIVQAKTAAIPEEVFEAFNEMIASHWNGRQATIMQPEVVDLVLSKLQKRVPDMVRQTIFRNHWLDVGGAYRAEGWIVVYDRPGFNESGEAFFTFKKKD